jgi:hypothetical protein
LSCLLVVPCADYAIACVEKFSRVWFANPDAIARLSAQRVPVYQLLNVDIRSNLAAAWDVVVMPRLVLTLSPRMNRIARTLRLC